MLGVGPVSAKARLISAFCGLCGLGVGCLVAWQLYGWESPSGLAIITLGVLGQMVGLGLTGPLASFEPPKMFRFRSEPPWPTVMKASEVIALGCIVALLLIASLRLIEQPVLRTTLSIACVGAFFVATAPLFLCLQSKLRRTWVAVLFGGLALILVSSLKWLGFDLPVLPLTSASVPLPLSVLAIQLLRKQNS
jgi:hypothetical protein